MSVSSMLVSSLLPVSPAAAKVRGPKVPFHPRSQPAARAFHTALLARVVAVLLACFSAAIPVTGHAAESDNGNKTPPTPQTNTKKQDNSTAGTSTQSTQTGPVTPGTKLNVPVIDAARQAAINNAAQPGAGTGGSSATDAARNQANTALDTSLTDQKKGVDQGFRGKPATIDVGGSLGSNPNGVSGTTPCVGGVLGNAACQSTGSTGAAGLGASLIQDGSDPATGGGVVLIEGGKTITNGSGSHVNPDGTINPVPGTTGEPVQNPFQDQADPNITKGVKGDVSNRQQLMDAATCELGDKDACARNNRTNAQKPATDNKGTPTTGDPNLVRHPSGNSTRHNDDGSVTHTQHLADGGYVETNVKKDTTTEDGVTTTTTTVTKTTYDKDGKKTGQTTTTGRPCDPTVCGSTPESLAQFYAEHPELLAQINQSRSGGSGDIDFGRGDNTPFVVDQGAVAPISGGNATGLVGNPGQRGGLGDTGSINTNTNFGNSRGAGVINPGPDGNLTTTGGRTDNVDERIGGGQPTRDLPNNGGSGVGSTTGSPVTVKPPVGTGAAPIQCIKGHPVPALRCPD